MDVSPLFDVRVKIEFYAIHPEDKRTFLFVRASGLQPSFLSSMSQRFRGEALGH